MGILVIQSDDPLAATQRPDRAAKANLFHPNLLGGYPREEFARSYEQGLSDFASSSLSR